MTKVLRLLALAAAACVVYALAVAFAATNTVPATHVGRSVRAIAANDLKPASCAALNLVNVVAGVTGTAGNDLLLGAGAAETLQGSGGVDCILAGGGDDIVVGNGLVNGDVCLGGPGTDTFLLCQNTVQ